MKELESLTMRSNILTNSIIMLAKVQQIVLLRSY